MNHWVTKVISIIGLSGLIYVSTTRAHLSTSNPVEGLLEARTIVASIQSKDSFKFDLQRLAGLGIDVLGVDHDAKILDVAINDFEYGQLNALGYDLEVIRTKETMRAPDSEYKNPEEVKEILTELNNKFPELTSLESIGKTVQGRDIWMLKISDNPNSVEAAEPKILFNAMHHAREVMGPEVVLDIAEYLTSNYGKDEKVTHWVNSNEIYVMPMFNPDGNNKVWTVDAWWRKNVGGSNGVDVNRNYPYKWGSCNGSSGSTWSQTYRGPEAASEPETKAMMKLVERLRPVFDISYHAYSELVIYPYGCSGSHTETKDVVEKVGKELAREVDYKPGTAWELLYSVDGGDIDWMYNEYQVIPFVVEVSSRAEGFQPDYYKWRDVTVERNRPGWQYLLNRLDESGVRGLVYSGSETVSSFKVRVNKVTDLGTEEVQNYRGNPDGSFHIVLNPGKYDLSFEANGVSQTKTVVIKDERINIDIKI